MPYSWLPGAGEVIGLQVTELHVPHPKELGERAVVVLQVAEREEAVRVEARDEVGHVARAACPLPVALGE